MVRVLCFLLLLSFPSYASDRYHSILLILSKEYILSYTSDKEVVAQLLIPRKHIVLNRSYMDTMSDDEVAWVIAHEMGHIHTLTVRNFHEDEYRADRFGKNLIESKGYKLTRENMLEIGKKLGIEDFDKSSVTHPAWNKRIDMLFNGDLRMIIENGVVVIR